MLYVLRAADLDQIKQAIAASPIVTGQSWLEARLNDWENTRRSPDVDQVILAWLASQRAERQAALS
jgi:hypothetical protein